MKEKYKSYKKAVIICEILVAILAGIIFVLVYLNNYKNVVKVFDTQATLVSNKQNAYFSQLFYSCRNIAAKGRTDKKYSSYYRNFDISAKLDIMDELGQYHKLIPYFDYVFFIDALNNNVWGTDGSYSYHAFAGLFDSFDVTILNGFLRSSQETFFYKSPFRSQSSTMVFFKPVANQFSAFLFVINDGTLTDFLGTDMYTDNVTESIRYSDQLIYTSGPLETNRKYHEAMISWNGISFVWRISHRELRVRAFVTASPYFLLLAFIWAASAILIAFLIDQGFKPIHKVLHHINDEFEMTGPHDGHDEFSMLIDTYDKLKEQNKEYHSDHLLFRLLFSEETQVNDDLLKTYAGLGIDLYGDYYFFCVFSSEDDYIARNELLDSFDRTNRYKLYISENNIVVLSVSKLDILRLREKTETLQKCFDDIYISDITDDVKYLRTCYMYTEQNRIARNYKNNLVYPYEEMKLLKAAMEMKNTERLVFIFNQLRIIAGKTDVKLSNEIHYEMLKLFVNQDSRAKLFNNRFNSQYLETQVGILYDKLLADCENNNKKPSKQPEQEKSIETIESYIKTHCTDKNYSQKSLACVFRMSYSNLCHYYNDNAGTTITEFTERYKLDNAKNMMRQGMKIYDIAEKLGYNSPQTFSRVFKKYEGKLPKDYLKSIRTEE